VECFLFASSGGAVYGDHNNPEDAFVESAATRPRSSYGVSKLAIEHYLRILGERDGRMRTMCLRISNPYGEGQRARRGQGFVAAVMESALTGSVLEIWGDDQIERDFVHVSDVAEAFVRAEAVVGAPAVLNVGSGRAVSLGEIIACVEEATGYPVRKRLVGPRSVDVRRNVLDISAAWRTLGWRPSVSLKDGLARTATWWAEVRVAEGAPLAERVDRTADEQSSGIKALGS
jgi:UDP-glucose 4-epimerase